MHFYRQRAEQLRQEAATVTDKKRKKGCEDMAKWYDEEADRIGQE